MYIYIYIIHVHRSFLNTPPFLDVLPSLTPVLDIVPCLPFLPSRYQGWCSDRAANGYNSGMGEIFRRVAMISPIDTTLALPVLSGISQSTLEGETAHMEL
jgi:hypothetical protein